MPLLRSLATRYPQAPVLLTHATPTGRAAGKDLFRDLGPRLRQCSLPYDLPFGIELYSEQAATDTTLESLPEAQKLRDAS